VIDLLPCVTLSGRVLDLRRPTPDQIFPLDIAHALGNICVLGGHTRRFYSMAEHAIDVAGILPLELRLRALLAFAPTAYLPPVGWDVLTPPVDLQQAHASLVEAISLRFQLAPRQEESTEIRIAIAMVRHAILRDLFPRHPGLSQYPAPPRFLKIGQGLNCQAARLSYFQALQQLVGDIVESQPMWHPSTVDGAVCRAPEHCPTP